MTDESWMLARLERDTAAHHAAAEADLFQILDEPTFARYRRFLAVVYQFEYAVEARIVCVEALPIRFVMSLLKSGVLYNDLLALGIDASAFGRKLEPPRFRDALDALGWLYVVQRNTLHHGALYRALAPHLRSPLQTAAHYLTFHTGDVHRRWRELGALLGRAASTPERAAQLVAAADAAFERQHRWYREARTQLAPPLAEIRA